MNDQDKLYFELGAKDNVTPIIEKLLKDSEKLQANFDNFKKITIKDIALKSDGALTAIKKQIQDSLNAEPFTIRIAPDVDTARVTEAARAIIEAQEKIVNAASKGVTMEAEAKVNTTTTDTTGASTANTQAARENTEAVQQQAKSYEELRAQVDAVLGSLTKNTATIVEEKNALRLIDQEMKVINKDVEKQGSMTDNQRKRLEQLTTAREKHKLILQSSMQSLRNDIKLAQAADGSMNELSQSLSRMRMAYRSMSEEQRNSDFGKELLASIQKADSKIKELDATIGNHQRNVGNYLGRSYNGLNMSLQQIVRELPNASLGFGMFTLAISNNIPILADQIKMAKEAAKAQKEMGQETMPVWKQLMKSFFSWQTALVLGVTLLTVYGKEIGNWAKQLFTGQRAAISTAEATENLCEALEKSDGKFSDNAMSIKKLASEWKELKSEAEKTAWIEANQSAFDQMGLSIRDVTSAERAFVEYTPAVIEALKARARGEAARELAKDKYKEAFLKREQARNEQKKGVSWIDRIAGNMSQISTTGTGNFTANQRGASANDVAKGRFEQRVKNLNDEADTLEKEIDVYYNISQLEDEKAKSELKRLGILKEQNKTQKEQLQAQKANLQAQLDILNEEEAAGAKGEDLRKKISDLDKRLSVYNTTKKDKADKAAANAAARAGEAAEKRMQILTKQGVEAERAAKDMVLSTRQAEIGAMEDSTAKTLQQIDLDKEKKLEAIRREYEDLKIKRIEEAKKLWDADPKNKGVNFYESESYKKAASDSLYSEAERNNRIQREHEVEAEYLRRIRKINEEETKAMLDYLKTYGNIEQKRFAIKKEFDDKIAKEDSEWRRKTLEKEREAALSNMSLEEFKKQNNWGEVFGNLDKMPLETIRKMIAAMKQYGKIAKMDVTETKAWYEAIEKLTDQAIVLDPINELTSSIEAYSEALKNEKIAKERYDIAQMSRAERKRRGIDESEVMVDAEQNLTEAQKKTAAAFETLKKACVALASRFQQLGNSLTSLGSSFGGGIGDVLGGFGTMFSQIGNGISAIKDLDLNAKGFTGVFNKVSAVLTTVTTMVEMNKALADILPSTESIYQKRAEEQKRINQLREAIDAYRVAVARARAEESGWIGDDPLRKLQDAYEIHGEIVTEYYNKLYEAQEAYIDSAAGIKSALIPIVAAITAIVAVVAGAFSFGSGAVGVGALGAAAIGALSAGTVAVTGITAAAIGTAIAAGVGAAVGQAIQSGIEAIAYKNGQVDARSNMKVQTQHRTFFRGEKTQNLEEWTKENLGLTLFDENGLIDLKAAQAVLDSGATLVGETKETLEKLMELREQYDEWEKSIKDYISSSFGGLADNMVDAIWDWLANGEDALDNFREYASDTFKKIAQDAVKTFLKTAVLDQFEDQLESLYKAYSMKDKSGRRIIDEQQLMLGVASIAGDMATALENIMPVAEQLGETIRTAFDYQGYDIVNGGSGSSSASRSIQSITESTGDLLAAYINAIRADSSVNRQTLTQILAITQSFSEMPIVAKAQLAQLETIARNTYETAQNTIRINDIYELFRKVTLGSESVRIR